MSAAAIAAALGDARREGRAWRCRCPLHGGRSLILSDGTSCLLATCWSGCDRRDVLTELGRRGLLAGRTDYYRPRFISAQRRNDDASRTARALDIWRAGTDGTNTIARRYLSSRGIEFDQWPSSLRFHPCCPRPRDDAGNLLPPLPAMVALVEHVAHGPVAVHCTYLKADGSGKAGIQKPKAIFGPVAGGAVRFGLARAGEWLAIAEGIETTLTVALSCSLPALAGLSANGIKNLMLPADASQVVVCADHDASGTGERAAHNAAARWLAEGRRVRVAMPPAPGSDFNDVLMGRTKVTIEEVRHVA
jgi:putative DNA primase/helicase